MLFLLCLLLGFLRGFPEMPTSSPINTDPVSTEQILSFLKGNFFSILYFCFSVVFCVLILYFGVSLRKKIGKNLSNSCLTLSAFILTSGIWMLTDSRIPFLFTGNTDRIYAIVFVSFVSFMLLPLLFLEFLKFFSFNRFLEVVDLLLFANLTVFLLFVLFKVPKNVFLYSSTASRS